KIMTRPGPSSVDMEGQREPERAADTQRALHPDASAVSEDDALGDVKAESKTPSIVGGDLQEALEHRLQLVGGDAHSGVLEGTPCFVPGTVETNDDLASRRRELDRVAEEVHE